MILNHSYNDNICCILNFPSHYNFGIYQKMGKELNCHFYFGDKLKYNIKSFDLCKLYGFKKILKTKYLIGQIYYMQKMIPRIFNYDKFLISGEPFGLSNWIFLFLCRLLGKQIFLWSHGWYGRENNMRKYLKKVFFSLANGTFLYGNYARNLMIKNGINPNKLHVIYNSLDYENQRTHRHCSLNNPFFEHFGNDFPTLIFIGRLNKSKKINLLLESIANMKKNKIADFNIVIVGTGDNDVDLLEYSKNIDIENQVWFYGPCYNEGEISNLISNSVICVSPGEVGLTAIHSLSYGTPVITHDNFSQQGPEFEAIIPNKTGAFFKENDIESLINSIVNLHSIILNDKQSIKKSCYEVIDTYYNPSYQVEVLKKVIL